MVVSICEYAVAYQTHLGRIGVCRDLGYRTELVHHPKPNVQEL